MRLLHTLSLTLHEFQEASTPQYAILSHVWKNEEVSFQDLQSGRCEKMAGYVKIKNCCAYAASQNWSYVWIDTCCIDKTSSAELSESINSMFSWYGEAEVCYAYLADVQNEMEPPQQLNSDFRRSKWFTRGWTLQELLAPREVTFLSNKWREIGTKRGLSKVISHITGVKDLHSFHTASVAQKMSWASKRITTRKEDIAYCLLGLFDINMPLLYGEGNNAFLRLQREILARSNDESILAWDDYSATEQIMAPSPARFEHSGDVHRFTFVQDRSPWTMTNQGLQMDLLLAQVGMDDLDIDLGDKDLLEELHEEVFHAPLNCKRIGSSQPLAMYLRENKFGRYRKFNVGKYGSDSLKETKREMIVLYNNEQSWSYGHAAACDFSISIKQTIFIQQVRFSKLAFTYSNTAKGWMEQDTERHFQYRFLPEEVLKGNQVARCERTVLTGQCFVIVLESKSHHPDFGVIFGNTKLGAWVDIIPNIHNPEIYRRLGAYVPNPPRQVDRISEVVGPGLSINAILRKKGVKVPTIGLQDNTPIKSSEANFELALEVANGELRWPEIHDDEIIDSSDYGSDSSMVARAGGGRMKPWR